MKKILLLLISFASQNLMAQLSIIAQNPNGSAESDNFSVFVKLGNKVIFNQGAYGSWQQFGGLWQSDGTVEGTTLLNPDLKMIAGAPYHNCVVGDNLFFCPPSGSLWKTNGTMEGTVRVREQYSGNNMGALENLLIYSVHPQSNTEETPSGLWRSDGTAAGTYKFSDVVAQFLYTAELDGYLYFMGSEGNDLFLWRTDGTSAGTSRVTTELDTPWGLTRQGNKLIFKARFHHPPVACNRGTSQNPIIEYYNQEPDAIMKIENGVISILKEPSATQYQPYGPNGCTVNDYLPTFTNVQNFYKTDNYLYFLSQEPVPRTVNNLWRTDGTSEGTIKLTEFPDGDPGISFNFFASNTFSDRGFTNIMYFPAQTSEFGSELWRSDGTPEGTFMLKDINPGVANSYPKEMRTVNGITYFFAYNPEIGEELWKTDGTVNGTQLVTDLNPGSADGFLRQDFEALPYDLFGTSVGNDYVFGGLKATTVGLFSTKTTTSPPTINAHVTQTVGLCNDCDLILSKMIELNGRNQYDLYSQGHFSTPIAKKYNISWDKSKWDLAYLERSGNTITEWQKYGTQGYNGLNTSPKPPCGGWSSGVKLAGDCQDAVVDITVGTGAPNMNTGDITSTGVVNGKNTYDIPVTSGHEGEKVVLSWDGSKWLMVHIDPGARTTDENILSVNNSNYGANPPCDNWSSGYGLSGDLCALSPLPVRLINFVAKQEEKAVLLKWNTATESNSDRFEIQKSPDAKTWQAIGSVTAQFESLKTNTYQFLDKNPVAGNSYYRLKMIDRDGTYTYTSLQVVNIRSVIKIFPNPTTEFLKIDVGESHAYSFCITTLSGEIVREQQIQHPDSVSEILLDVSNFSSGLYLLIIKGTDINETLKFVKK